MTRWVLLVALCSTQAAVAQPVTRPDIEPCRVTIAFAPEDVRAEIEGWVRAEPRCERELEVRVVPTEEGLYLQARDGSGRVRERVVPDAQSAAVLVVSWMADDSLGATYTSPILEPPSAMRDAEMPDLDGPAVVASVERARASPRSERWLTLGALGSSRRGGFRGQIDLFSGRRWSIGVGGGVRGDHDSRDGVAQARLLFSTQRTFGRVSLRAQLGVGADVANRDRMDHDDDDDDDDDNDMDDRMTPMFEAGVLARIQVIGAWGLIGGPLLEAAKHRDEKSVSFFLGVQRGL